MAHTLEHHLTYNLWANQRIGNLLLKQDEAVLNTEQKSSFSSIAKTVLHLWDAEVIWLTRLKGETIAEWPSKKFAGGKAEMVAGMLQTSTELMEFVKSQPATFLDQTITYKNMKGDAYQNRVEEILFHLVNHGTYHRGQITTLLRQMGATDLVSTDLIGWFREKNK